MSTNETNLTVGGGGGGGDADEDVGLDQLVPKLVQEREVDVAATPAQGEVTERREFEPVVVTRLGGTLPWDTQSEQLQCGETVTDTTGDMNLRVVYHCVATHDQFKTLQTMRTNPEGITLVSRAYTGPVTFDELKFDRIPDANGAVLRGQGSTTEPLYEIQLQSKESDDDSVIGNGE